MSSIGWNVEEMLPDYWPQSEHEITHNDCINDVLLRPASLLIPAPSSSTAIIHIPVKCDFRYQDLDELVIPESNNINEIDIQLTSNEMKNQDLFDSNQEITDDDLIRISLTNKLLMPFIYQWLSIERIILILSFLNNHDIIQNSNIIAKSTLYEVFDNLCEIKSNPKDHTLEFASYILHDCINAIRQPFDFGSIHPRKCISIKKLFQHTSCYFETYTRNLQRICYTTYILFQLKEYKLWYSIFKHTSLSFYINLFLPFTHTNIPQKMIHEVKISDFYNYIESINTKSNHLEKIFSDLWLQHNIDVDHHHDEQEYNDEDTFFTYFSIHYGIYNWFRYINWECFFIAGGSVISAIINSPPSSNADIDIFCEGLNLNAFSFEIKKFQTKLMKRRIAHQMIFLHESMFTFILMCKKPYSDEDQCIRLQFIWTCQMANIARTISSFDLAASQIAFKPFPVNCIYFTDACLYFLITSECLVYNTNIHRINKYVKKGIYNFLFKSINDLPINCKPIKLDSTDYLKLQLNDDDPFVLAKHPYYEFTSGHNQFRNKNIDNKNMFNRFINQLLLSA